MPSIRFEWDEAKNLANQRKHGVSFEDASELFEDPLYVVVSDRIVDGEQRWHTFGLVNEIVLLMAVHTVEEVEDDGPPIEIVRIISARRATPKERRTYENQNG
jgi:uncharacterized DUF497 family protein